MSRQSRINNEIRYIQEYQQLGLFNYIPSIHKDDEFDIMFTGPVATPYEAGDYVVHFRFDLNHPFSPPHARFKTRIMHPNISESGIISLDILTNKIWSPALMMHKLILSVISLLDDPNFSNPLNYDAAAIYIADPDMYAEL